MAKKDSTDIVKEMPLGAIRDRKSTIATISDHPIESVAKCSYAQEKSWHASRVFGTFDAHEVFYSKLNQHIFPFIWSSNPYFLNSLSVNWNQALKQSNQMFVPIKVDFADNYPIHLLPVSEHFLPHEIRANRNIHGRDLGKTRNGFHKARFTRRTNR